MVLQRESGFLRETRKYTGWLLVAWTVKTFVSTGMAQKATSALPLTRAFSHSMSDACWRFRFISG